MTAERMTNKDFFGKQRKDKMRWEGEGCWGTIDPKSPSSGCRVGRCQVSAIGPT